MRYTPHDMDEIRKHIQEIRGPGEWHSAGIYARPCSFESIERELVTYMAAGTKVEEIKGYADEKKAERRRKQEWFDAMQEIKVRLCSHADFHNPRERMKESNNGYWHGYADYVGCGKCGMYDRRKSGDRRADLPEVKEKRRG